jgi:hypothetical protein
MSFEAQAEKLQQYAALYDLERVGLDVDRGVSTKTLRRPALQEALARLQARTAEGILVVAGPAHPLGTGHGGADRALFPPVVADECRRANRHPDRGRAHGAEYPGDRLPMGAGDHFRAHQ